MRNRDECIREINAACDELKHAGIPHAIDLAKHICKMKKELNAYDKCMKPAKHTKDKFPRSTARQRRI